MHSYVLDPDRLTIDQRHRVGSALQKAGTPQARLEPITVTIAPDGTAFVEYEAVIVLSPDAVNDLADIIYLHSE